MNDPLFTYYKTINPKTLLFNNQDKDNFIFYDLNENKVSDIFNLPSAFTQHFLSSDSCLLCAFDGAILNYNIINKKVSSKNNIKKLIKNTKIQNFVANPPYVNKILYNEKIIPDNIFISLLNGSIVSINKNSKKNFIKEAFNCNILDYKFFKNDSIVALGKDYKIKFFDVHNKLETKFFIELNEPATYIETWDLSQFNIGKAFGDLSLYNDSDDKKENKGINNIGYNYENEIYYIDSNSKKLKRIILK